MPNKNKAKAKASKAIKNKIQQQVQLTLFGNLPDGIEPNPQYKRYLGQEQGQRNIVEAVGGKLAVFTFGRMNPPTTGHEKLVQRLVKTAMERGGTPHVFLSHATDRKNNPLNYKEKVRLAKKAFGDVVQVSNAKNIFEIAKELNKKYDRIVMVVGSDRVTEFQRMLTEYNGKEYNFADIHVISAGERDPDSAGVSGMSASLMRNYAAAGNMGMFAKGLPARLQATHKQVFDMVRNSMLAESTQVDEEKPCWDGYQMVGMKMKNGRRVPNCVPQVKEDVSSRQLDDVERFADRLLGKFNIDIEFTRHFVDRVNDSRNDPDITVAELQRFFKKIARDKGNQIHNHEDLEVVLKDVSAFLNLPAVIERQPDGDFEVTLKTIMRKRDFRSTSPSVVYEAIMTRTYANQFGRMPGTAAPGSMAMPVGGMNTKNAANHRTRRDAEDRRKGTPDTATDVRKKAEGKAMSRIAMDAMARSGPEAYMNPNPDVRQAEMEKGSSEYAKFQKYSDEEERNLKRASVKPVKEEMIVEAKYQGETVKLNKPIRNSGGKKKFKVYTTHPTTGNVIKVQFGDPNMSIKRDSDKRRAAFRSRHGCDALTFEDDRHKASYWSCKMWEKGKSVSSITEGLTSAERALKTRVSAEKGAGAGVDISKQEIRDLRDRADDLMYTGKQSDQDKALKIKKQIRQYSRQQMFKEDEQLNEFDFPAKDQLKKGARWALTKAANKDLGKATAAALRNTKDRLGQNLAGFKKPAATALIGLGAYGAYKGAEAIGKTKAYRTARNEYQKMYDTLKNS